jgi:hypothetical protein
MTPALRKYHRHVWYFLSGFLPIFFVAAIMVIPEQRADPSFPDNAPPALPEVLNSVETETLAASLRTDRLSGTRQLEVSVKKPLTTPAALVYVSGNENDRPEEGVLLGALTSVGTSRFHLGEGQHFSKNYIRVFDPVKNQIIQNLEL